MQSSGIQKVKTRPYQFTFMSLLLIFPSIGNLKRKYYNSRDLVYLCYTAKNNGVEFTFSQTITKKLQVKLN